MAEVIEKLVKRLDSSSNLRLAYVRMCTRGSKMNDLPFPDAALSLLEGICPKPQASRRSVSFNHSDSCDVSVIVPVYNTEKYVADCLRSACGQEGDFSLEVIVVNDGSSDGSRDIVQACAAHDDRIRLIDRENGGLSAARNTGMSASRGRYICFLDSDDMFNPDHVFNLLSVLDGTRNAFSSGVFRRMTEDGIVKGAYEKTRTHGGACGRLYPRELWNDVCFPEKYLFEDTVIAYCIKSRYREIHASDAGYLRRGRSTSITATASQSPRAIESYWILEEMLEWCRDLGVSLSSIREQTLLQLGPVLYDRCRNFDKDVLKALFVCAREMYASRFSELDTNGLDDRCSLLVRALMDGNYSLWLQVSRWL